MANIIAEKQKKGEIGTAYIIQKGIFKIVPIYEYSELSIVDEILKPKKIKKKVNLTKFLTQKEGDQE